MNSNGQIGDGTTTDRHIPAYASMGGMGALKVSAGSYHTCAITIERDVMCWGENWNGQLGDSSNADRNSPVEVSVPSNSSAVSIDSGAFHSCVGMNDGSMFCWGYNAHGQLGNGGSSDSNSPLPSSLSSDLLLMEIEVGLFHSLSLIHI